MKELEGVRGGIEFEFASDISHADFAALLAKKLKIKKRSIRVTDDYINSATHDKDYSVWGVEYDSSIPTEGKFKTQTEVVMPVLPLREIIDNVDPMFNLIAAHGITSLGTGMHITLSIDGVDLKRKLDPVKFMTLLDEYYYGEEFGRLEQSTYAKSQIPRLIEKIKREREFLTIGGAISHLLTVPHRIGDKVFDYGEKKTAVNFSKVDQFNVIEFRLPGGKDYHLKNALVKRTVIDFASALVAACDPKARIRDYVRRLVRLIEDSRPSAPDPLVEKLNRSVSKTIWLKRRSNGRTRHTLCDITDGPVQKSKEWADSHFVVKLVTERNPTTGVEELLGVGDGSGWNESLTQNLDNEKAVHNRRLDRIVQHSGRNRHKYRRILLKDKSKYKSTFMSSKKTPSSYHSTILSLMTDRKFALPSNHMSRGFIGIDISPTIAQQLSRNPSMAPYLAWYYADAICRKKLTEFPSNVLYYAVRQKSISVEELVELALAYIVPRPTVAVPLSVFYRAHLDGVMAEFVRLTYAGMKHYEVDLESNAAKAFIAYGTKLSKFPSKQFDLLHAYTVEYVKKTRARHQTPWKPLIGGKR